MTTDSCGMLSVTADQEVVAYFNTMINEAVNFGYAQAPCNVIIVHVVTFLCSSKESHYTLKQ